MALVDLILRLLGENPAAYYPDDKWVAVISFLVTNDNYFMPWLLGGLPLLWLGIRKWRKKQITTTMVIVAVVAAILLGFVGFFILDFLSDLAFGLSYQRMYGDLFN